METSNQQTMSFKTRTIKRILPTLFISAIVPFVLFICLPIEIFANNLDEFNFALKDFLPACFLMFLIATCIIFFATVFLPQKAYRIVCAIILAGGLMCFIQGTFLNAGFNSLGGDNMGEQVVTKFSKILNLFIWLIVIAGAIVLACLKDKNGIISIVGIIVGIIVLITQFMSPFVLVVSKEGIFMTKEERLMLNNDSDELPSILSTKNMTTVSSQKNIFVFCIDRLDQEYVDQAYIECPEVFSELDGFTAFNDNLSKYGRTFPGVVNLLTTSPCNLNLSRAEYLNTVYKENKTLNVLEENGYSFNLYMPSLYTYENAENLPKNTTNLSKPLRYIVKDKLKLPLKMIQTSFYRSLPTLLKKFVGTVDSNSANILIGLETNDDASFFTTDMKDIWFGIKDQPFSISNNKQFTYIHLEGCHSTMYDENWNKTSNLNSPNVLPSLKNSFVIINKYLTELKNKGLYDDATIIITGDHGSPTNDHGETDKPTLTGLFFKRAGESGTPMVKSNAQVCHDNLWPAILTDVGITPDASLGRSLFDISESETTTREYIWHTYESPTTEYFYEIKGAGKDFSNWTLTSQKTYDKHMMD